MINNHHLTTENCDMGLVTGNQTLEPLVTSNTDSTSIVVYHYYLVLVGITFI